MPVGDTVPRCPLCDQPASIEWIAGSNSNGYRVRCDVCLEYTATPAFIAECERARANGRTEILDAFSGDAAATRGAGGYINFDVDWFETR
jgi:hypothetical protein